MVERREILNMLKKKKVKEQSVKAIENIYRKTKNIVEVKGVNCRGCEILNRERAKTRLLLEPCIIFNKYKQYRGFNARRTKRRGRYR